MTVIRPRGLWTGPLRFPRSPYPGARRFGGRRCTTAKSFPCRISCRSGPADGQRVEPVDAVDRAVFRLPVEGEARHARRQERQRLLELRAGEVGAEAVVHPGAERERLAL